MNLLSLGTTDRALFAIHEPAAHGAGPPRAAVICNPWGREYVFAHRSLRHLAVRLARRGFHTVRFDYFGSGDSGGEEWQVDLAGMESDVRSAMEAAQDIAGSTSVALVGLRLGANIAARVAGRDDAPVGAIVAWDPILSGESYVESLLAPPCALGSAARDSRLMRELRALERPAAPPGLRERSLLLMTVPEELAEEGALAAEEDPRLAEWPERASIRAPACWLESATTSGALPVAIIRRIEEWLL